MYELASKTNNVSSSQKPLGVPGNTTMNISKIKTIL